MWEFVHYLVVSSDSAIIWYFVAVNSFHLLLLLLSIPQIWRHWEIYKNDEVSRYIASDALPAISVLVPAHDMQATIETSVNCLLALSYATHEVVVVNDGSRDETLEHLRRAFDLYEVPSSYRSTVETKPVKACYRSRTRANLLVVDKVQGGKADAVNAALNAAQHPLVLCVDADTLLEHDALLRLARPFVLYPNVAAAGATVRVLNGCTVVNRNVEDVAMPRRFLAGLQVPEYLRGFLFGRLGWNALGGNLIISGAFGLFRRDYLVAVGGYDPASVGEDVELVIRLHRYLLQNDISYQMPFIPDPVAWTEVPADVTSLARQRERWHRGLATSLARNFELFFNYRYGKIGLVVFPFFVLGELLAPLVEFYGLLIVVLGLCMGLLGVQYAATFALVAWGYGVMVTLVAVVMEEATFRRYERTSDFLRMIGYALCEPLGYRQLTVLWRLNGLRRAMTGRREWGEMRRRGFVEAQSWR